MSYGVRKKFYNSKAWKTVRKNVWIRQQLLCARCYKPVYVDGISSWLPKEQRRTGIVHHKIYLDNTNVSDPNVTLNQDNLEGICKECHEKEHHQNISTRNDYLFDENGNLLPKD